jgi:hypothetical protein
MGYKPMSAQLTQANQLKIYLVLSSVSPQISDSFSRKGTGN